MQSAPNADRFQPLPPERAALWRDFGRNGAFFPGHLGIVLEEVRTDYARMRLPYRPELSQPAGVMHGGALATLVDTVVVPAIGGGYTEPRPFFTVDLHVQYLESLSEDAIAEGWIERRGRSLVFCRVEVRSASGRLVAAGMLTYKVGGPIDARQRTTPPSGA